MSDMILEFVWISIGLLCLYKGADWMVDGAVDIAHKYKINELTIGLTVVALGTSLPELVVNIFASVDGKSAIIIGNIIGSNVFNSLFILSVAGLIQNVFVSAKTRRFEIPFSVLVVVLVMIFGTDLLGGEVGTISRFESFLLLIGFFLFVYYNYYNLKHQKEPPEVQNYGVPVNLLRATGFLAVGVLTLICGGRLVVESTIDVAQSFQISEKLIAQTLVAGGTSLPELATTIVAVKKGRGNIAIGNLIGSNIFNVTLVLAISGLINTIENNRDFNDEIFLLVGGAVFFLFSMVLPKRYVFTWWKAIVLLSFFIVYSIYIFS